MYGLQIILANFGRVSKYQYRAVLSAYIYFYYIYTCTYIEDNFQVKQKAFTFSRDANSCSSDWHVDVLPISQLRNIVYESKKKCRIENKIILAKKQHVSLHQCYQRVNGGSDQRKTTCQHSLWQTGQWVYRIGCWNRNRS